MPPRAARGDGLCAEGVMLIYRRRHGFIYLSLFGHGYLLTHIWPISNATLVARLGRWRLCKC